MQLEINKKFYFLKGFFTYITSLYISTKVWDKYSYIIYFKNGRTKLREVTDFWEMTRWRLRPNVNQGLLAQVQNSCIILLCSKCLIEEISVAFLPEGRTWGKGQQKSTNAFLLIFDSTFLPLTALWVVPPPFPFYSLGGSSVVYIHCGKYLSFLVVEMCSSSSLLWPYSVRSSSIIKLFAMWIQNLYCYLESLCCTNQSYWLSSLPNWKKALCQLIYSERNYCSAFSLNFLSFLAKLSMSKSFAFASTDIRTLLLARVLKNDTEFDNMKLHERIDYRAKGTLKVKSWGKVKLESSSPNKEFIQRVWG